MSSVHTPVSADVNSTLVLRHGDQRDRHLLDRDVGGVTQVSSGSPTQAPTSVGAPTILGDLDVGSTLTALPGGWTGNPTAYTYQWEYCLATVCGPLTGATNSSYLLTRQTIGCYHLRGQGHRDEQPGLGHDDVDAERRCDHLGPNDGQPADDQRRRELPARR